VGKEIEMTPAKTAIPAPMREATSALAEHLLQSEPFLRYQAADRRLRANPEAMQLLADLAELQQKIRGQQYAGAISEGDLTRLRELQGAVRKNEIIQDHGMMQELTIALLREVNQEISNVLGVDFASLTRRSGGCC